MIGGVRPVHIFSLATVSAYVLLSHKIKEKRLLYLFVYPLIVSASILINKSYDNFLFGFDLIVLILFTQSCCVHYSIQQYLRLIKYASLILASILLFVFCYHLIVYGTVYQFKEITGIKALFGLSPLFYLFTTLRTNSRNSLIINFSFSNLSSIYFILLCSLTLLSGERKAILSSFLSLISFYFISSSSLWISDSMRDNKRLNTILTNITKLFFLLISSCVLLLYLFSSSITFTIFSSTLQLILGIRFLYISISNL